MRFSRFFLYCRVSFWNTSDAGKSHPSAPQPVVPTGCADLCCFRR